MLSCECDYDDYDNDAVWYYNVPEWFQVHLPTRRKRCKSCGKFIAIGDECLEFERSRDARSEIEERIYGSGWDAVPLASYYHCKDCGEIYLNLSAIGYCIPPDTDMQKALQEYHELSGFKKDVYEVD